MRGSSAFFTHDNEGSHETLGLIGREVSGRDVVHVLHERFLLHKKSLEMVVRPKALKSSSKERAGMFLSSPDMRTRERASTKEIFLSLPKRLNKAMD